MIPGRPGSGSFAAGVVPTAPQSVSAAAGNTTATVSFSAPSYQGKGGGLSYTVTSSGGQTASGSGSPIVVSGLSNGVSYTFTVTASTTYGITSPSSSASNAVTPVAPPSFGPPVFSACNCYTTTYEVWCYGIVGCAVGVMTRYNCDTTTPPSCVCQCPGDSGPTGCPPYGACY